MTEERQRPVHDEEEKGTVVGKSSVRQADWPPGREEEQQDVGREGSAWTTVPSGRSYQTEQDQVDDQSSAEPMLQ